ncbi:lysophospholipid transporter LplT [Ottowia testudinis]|uniref:Lysophospholipid transporter LplT n=1 Tax=Ottowia testudinis TaxID=2816950 RepID=A0A975CKB2_9BURK|nr:lysophospholipid transporter LplT [Ottowia testudinis]QTD46567.1 lysophospholipid transporter LplT [Ottowia testudinis]
MRRGIGFLIAAQFVSGLADNALLIVAMARLAELGQSAWLAPLLKAVFTLAYVVLAPWAGALADRWPKARVMLAANGLKALACALMALAIDPLLAFALAGVGAAAYSPAKYGLVTELSAPADLVRANGWLEVTTVGAIILGTALGGLLVGPWLLTDATRQLGHALPVSTPLGAAILLVLALYALAGALNLLIPASGAQPHAMQPSFHALLARFAHAQRTLWRDAQGGLSLGVTTLFWGAGATLQFVVLAWAQQNLGLSLSNAAYLQGVVAIGIGVGALAAGRWVQLQQAPRVLPLGVLMGACVPLLTLVHSVGVAAPLLATVGALAGFFVVPMNALLQHRGQQLLGAGESIAVQNFNENLCVLGMLGAYAALQMAGWPLHRAVFALGAVVALGVLSVMWRYRLMGGRKQLLKGEHP